MGPSGMTVEHLSTPLGPPKRLAEVLQRMQTAGPCRFRSRFRFVRLGRLTALQKPNGGVPGIVSGDIVRKLVARTMSQQLMDCVQRATAPYQCAMSTKSGCECIAHALQGRTHFHLKTVSSTDTFIQKRFHPMTLF